MEGVAVGAMVAVAAQRLNERVRHLLHHPIAFLRSHAGLERRGLRGYGSRSGVGVGLRAPADKVGGLHACPPLTLGRELPGSYPGAVGSLRQRRVEHLLHPSPWPEIAVDYGIAVVELLPRRPIGAPGEPQATLTIGVGIRKDIDGVGLIGIGRRRTHRKSRHSYSHPENHFLHG